MSSFIERLLLGDERPSEDLIRKPQAIGISSMEILADIRREELARAAMRHLTAWHRREFGDRTPTRPGADARALRVQRQEGRDA